MEILNEVLLQTTQIDETEASLQSNIVRHLQTLQHVSPGKPIILTVTVTVSTSIQSSNLFMIKDFVERQNLDNLIIQPIHTSNRTRKPKYRFQNSVPLRLTAEDKSRRCIKIFRNGRLLITGVKGGKDLIEILHRTGQVIGIGLLKNLESNDKRDDTVNVQSELNGLGLDSGRTELDANGFQISGVKINMMNLQFYIGLILDLIELKESIKSKSSTDQLISSVEYNSDRCPALILKRLIVNPSIVKKEQQSLKNRKNSSKSSECSRVSTLMIYRCGCIKICGLREPMEALDPYMFITSLLDSHPQCLCT